jgi:hypothetical protein
MFLLLFSLCVVLVMAFILVWTIKNGISPAPTTRKIRKAIIPLLPEHIEGTIVELGSGWGGMALFFAEKYPNAHVVAFETSFIPWLVSIARAWCSHQKNIHFKRKDFFLQPLSHTKLLFCYLSAPLMSRLQEKLVRDKVSGAAIISHTFALPGYTASKTIAADDLYHTKIYLYLT